MAVDFNNRISKESIHNAMLKSLGVQLSDEDVKRLNRYQTNWNFYDGFHWEGMPDNDKPQITENFIRAFVDKFVSFELGAGFFINMLPHIENLKGENNPYKFLEEVWEYNNRLEKSVELGQSKSITGDGWIQVFFENKFNADGTRNPNFYDPFDEYEKGKISIAILPSSICFPKYSSVHNKEQLESFTIMYPIEEEEKRLFRTRGKMKQTMYKQVWYTDRVEIYYSDMNSPTEVIYNKYNVIPLVHVKNFPQQGKNEGLSDIEDLIPLNAELNLKLSDISEIIDYHSAPITVVYGARVSQLERGANKVWGGLPHDAKVENLRLEGDLNIANGYIDRLKTAMHEVGNIPEGVLGGNLSISNTSGVALQITLLPLLERVKIKQVLTKEGLEEVNKLILLLGEKEGLIKVPEGVKRAEFFKNEVTFGSILPKDKVLELQEIEQEMRLQLLSREDAMKRLGRSHIQKKIADIDADKEKNPEVYGLDNIDKQAELAKQLAEAKGETKIPESDNRKIGENKEGNPKQINAGFTNSPEKKN